MLRKTMISLAVVGLLAGIAAIAPSAQAGQSVGEKASRSAEHAQNMTDKFDKKVDLKQKKLAKDSTGPNHDAKLAARIGELLGKIGDALASCGGLCGSTNVP